jgi:hypothetical protein
VRVELVHFADGFDAPVALLHPFAAEEARPPSVAASHVGLHSSPPFAFLASVHNDREPSGRVKRRRTNEGSLQSSRWYNGKKARSSKSAGWARELFASRMDTNTKARRVGR